jgi:hypothetical protein
MEITFPHEIEFTTKDQVSVEDVAKSLVANASILLYVGKVLEQCFPDLQIERIKPRFVSATTSSLLKEALAVDILSNFQEDLKREVPKLIEGITGAHLDPQYATVVTVVFFVVLLYGLDKACEFFKTPRVGSDSASPPSLITGNYGTVINISGGLFGIPPSEIAGAVQRSIPLNQRRALAKTAVNFVRPAKHEPGASIIGAGLTITPEAIEDTPGALDIALEDDDEEKTDGYSRVKVILHAYDIDHVSSGWAGHIDGVWDKRIRLKLSPTIQPNGLFGRESVVADIILVSKKRHDGSYVPTLIHLIDIYD